MKKSFKPGIPPLMSKDLIDLFADNEDGDITIDTDDFDKIISSNNLRIKHFISFRDLDLAVFILNNRKIIQRPLSSYAILEKALEQELSHYHVSDSGIHWPDLDADISLRGLLIEETVKLAVA
ncbi:DUF2442 domain-containing protein [Dyadobacter arcticus]|uniref:DUF2442 domain-containing protein n=1 Tax=Dyadobacter arcticus TaxID=1078754 RepID=A0ABX0UP05_9BACT|nr:DUF2442 domain-containing protein [Dyadobacter arcticus]NIJ53400.1 hypothetical protein [Dyadobacter arcticus]